MLLADRLKVASEPTSTPFPSLISPVKGWNTRDALDAMDPADAVQLDNWYPDSGGCIIRNGYQSYAHGMGSGTQAVETLAEYSAATTDTFLAVCGGKFYDISASGAVGAPLASGFSTVPWQTVYFLSNLFFMNGTDTMQVYDGSTVANATFTGVTLSTLIGGIQYQNRLFFWASGSTGFWYALLNSINGALAFYDLSVWSPRGGNLVAAVTYSHDGGNGVLDFVCFIMSSGDCLLYYGNDPADVNNWQLIGIYRISPPVNIRAVTNYGAEAFVTTFDDHVPLEQELVALQHGSLPPRSKVSTAVRNAVIANGSGFGWQALYYPALRALIFNIPNPDGTFSQHVQNTGISYQDSVTSVTTSPWCQFLNWNGSTFSLYKNNLFFGGADGVVYQANIGTLDNLQAVNAVAQQSWNTFNDPQRKHMTAARPLVESSTPASFVFGLGFDYGPTNIITEAATPSGTLSFWNVSPWNTSPWSSGASISTLWYASGGNGTAVSPSITMNATDGGTWFRTDFKGERGTAL